MIRIDKDVPIPGTYPFEQMKVGDSFAVPASVRRETVSVSAKRYGDKHKAKFTVRQVAPGVFRCWRVA